jgi:hypothetical protein
MTLCPIALAVGCEKCPAFKFCPLTTVLGDIPKAADIPPSRSVTAPAPKAKSKVSRRPKRRR